MNRKTEDLALTFKALSDPSRLRLLTLLAGRRAARSAAGGTHQGSLCVNALVAELGMKQSAVSQHLRVLRHAGLVRGSRQGAFVHYSLDQDALDRCMQGLARLVGSLPKSK